MEIKKQIDPSLDCKISTNCIYEHKKYHTRLCDIKYLQIDEKESIVGISYSVKTNSAIGTHYGPVFAKFYNLDINNYKVKNIHNMREIKINDIYNNILLWKLEKNDEYVIGCSDSNGYSVIASSKNKQLSDYKMFSNGSIFDSAEILNDEFQIFEKNNPSPIIGLYSVKRNTILFKMSIQDNIFGYAKFSPNKQLLMCSGENISIYHCNWDPLLLNENKDIYKGTYIYGKEIFKLVSDQIVPSDDTINYSEWASNNQILYTTWTSIKLCTLGESTTELFPLKFNGVIPIKIETIYDKNKKIENVFFNRHKNIISVLSENTISLILLINSNK